MSVHFIHLANDLDPVLHSRVKSGDYGSASEVMSSALRLLEREECEREEKVSLLKSAVEEGMASGEAEADLLERLYAYIDELAGEEAAKEKPCRTTA